MELCVVKKEPLYLSEDGIVLSEAVIALPEAADEDKACRAVNYFYKRIGDALERITRSILLPLSRELYAKSDDPRKRFTHRPFRLLCECHLTADEGGVLVKRMLSVRHRGRIVYERCDRERITEDGLILPWKGKSPK